MSSSPNGAFEADRIASGVAGLDRILGGGLMVGGIYILQGAPGAGKTILTNQICFNHVARGGHATYVTLLSENHARMLDNMRRMSFFDESVIPDRLVYISASSQLRDGGLQALLQLLRREIQTRKTSVLVIDGFVSVHAIAGSDQDFKQFVHDLQEIALATDCTLFLTTNDTRAVSPERTMVDGLIALSNRNPGWHSTSDLEVTKFRGSGFIRGRHSYQITTRGVLVHPRIEALYAYPTRRDAADDEDDDTRETSGIGLLDTILNGGLPTASTTVLVGPPGIGKTTMGLQFLAQCSDRQPGLMSGFYETPKRLRRKIGEVFPDLRAMFDRGVVELAWQPPTNLLVDAYGEQLLEEVRRRNVKRLFIDGLTALQSDADPSRVGNFFSALANELRGLGVTTLYSLETPDTVGPTGRLPLHNASGVAENIIQLRFGESASGPHRLLSVLKVRDSNFDPSAFGFSLTSAGVRIDASTQSIKVPRAPVAALGTGIDVDAPGSATQRGL